MALSPMMQQYVITKEKYQDCILFYRLGDFYEMFFEDAIVASKALDLVLTGRDCGLPEKAPMCGIPHHAAETYISRLIEQGFKVALCEQLTQPKKGVKLVERDVVRVVTPGTLIDTALLDDKTNNYIASVYKDSKGYGVSYVDISAGIIYLTEFSGQNAINDLNDVLIRVKPKEVLSNSEMFVDSMDLVAYKLGVVPKFASYSDTYFDLEDAKSKLADQMGLKTIMGKDYSSKDHALKSVGALLNYLNETQKRAMIHINSCEYLSNERYMQLDSNTRRNLELTETIRERKKKGSLLWLLDKTHTSMGARMIRTFVDEPLYDGKEINERLNAVEDIIKNPYLKDSLIASIKNIYDIERLCGKISYGNITPKDTLSLLHSLSVLPEIKQNLNSYNATYIKDIYSEIFDYKEITNLLSSAITDNPPINLRDGGIIKEGYNNELDELINISSTGKNWLAELEIKEKEETGIRNLKIGFNNVFGYFLEVPKGQVELVPFRYTRKQTIANAERYITEELKLMEDKILNAEEKRLALEIELFNEIRNILLESVSPMQTTSRAIARLDAIISLAQVAIENNYVKPIISNKIKSIDITNGRHPVVEKILKDEEFVPNDTLLDNADNRTMIITGPNMAGKSTYMRQVALITLMAHIGSYVPASQATISLTDKIFTRVGASDDLAFGQSTFMVEMVEVSNILKQATDNSLILLDEVGRGTSTFDGLSIAWSVMEHLAKHQKSKTLFATHYHELTELEGVLEGVKNYRINVKEFHNSIIFLRKIVRGGANKSFGIEVAKLAGLPESVIERAKEILMSLEENEVNKSHTINSVNNNIDNDKRYRQNQEVVNILKDIKINNLTPLGAFDILVQLLDKVN